MPATGTVILALGFVASAIAVVPSFDQLLHGNKTYVAVTSPINLGPVIGGVVMLVAESSAGPAVVMGAMVVLWLIATIHHSLPAKATLPTPVDKLVRTGQGRDPAELADPSHGAHPGAGRMTRVLRRRTP